MIKKKESIKKANDAKASDRIALIFVGDELLDGRVLNTSSKVLSRLLVSSGQTIGRHLTIGDDPTEIIDVLRSTKERLIVICGGLGATDDDRTLASAARAYKTDLLFDPNHMKVLQKIKEKRGLSENFLKQACTIRGAITCSHKYGSAPFIAYPRGLAVSSKGASENQEQTLGRLETSKTDELRSLKDLSLGDTMPIDMIEKMKKDFNQPWTFFLAGVPYECENVGKDFLIPFLAETNPVGGENVLEIVVLDMTELNASSIIEKKFSKEDREDIKISYLPKGGKELLLRFSCYEKKKARRFRNAIKRVFESNGNYCYLGAKPLSEHVHDQLVKENIDLAIAESCSGGGLSASLCQYPGASRYLDRALVTYSNLSKENLLDIERHALKKYGAVSQQVAEKMAQNLYEKLKKSLSNQKRGDGARRSSLLTVSITGIAGPGSDSSEKPVGLVYIAICSKEIREVEKVMFEGERTQIQMKTIKKAFIMLLKHLKKMKKRDAGK